MIKGVFIFALYSFALCANSGPLPFDADQVMRSVNKECEGYARIQTDARWEVVARRIRDRGLEPSSDYKQSLFKMNVAECVLIQSISIMDTLKGSTSPSDWSRLKGDESLLKLHANLRRIMESSI